MRDRMDGGFEVDAKMAKLDLTGHRVLITGAGQGIGRGIAETFANWGARVAVADVSEKSLMQTCKILSVSSPESFGLRLDVTDEGSVDAGVKQVWDRFGGIDLLVNNAGVLSVADTIDLTLDAWNRVLAVNTTGVFLMSRAVVRKMIEQRQAGSIVSIASIAGKRGDPGLAHYSASKFAVVGFTQALAREVGRQDIMVNAICPGVVRTNMIATLEKNSQADTTTWMAAQCIQRIQTPEDIAFAAGFLHLSRAISGQAINVDGGSLFH